MFVYYIASVAGVIVGCVMAVILLTGVVSAIFIVRCKMKGKNILKAVTFEDTLDVHRFYFISNFNYIGNR